MEKSLLLLISQYVHKINNTIGLIRGSVKMLEFQRSELLQSDEMLLASLETIKNNAEKALSLAEDFKLSFSTPPSIEYASIETILSQALQSSNLPQSINVTLEVEEGLPDLEVTNSFFDVFRNLFSNASEAMPDGGELKIMVNLNEAEELIEINIADTGRGMPPYVIRSLFQPYFSTKNQKGHGLGLWWSKSYLIGMGGDLELAWSEVGKGSRFLISLPVPEKQEFGRAHDGSTNIGR
jgi:two-component system NtrC family sensor kinase